MARRSATKTRTLARERVWVGVDGAVIRMSKKGERVVITVDRETGVDRMEFDGVETALAWLGKNHGNRTDVV